MIFFCHEAFFRLPFFTPSFAEAFKSYGVDACCFPLGQHGLTRLLRSVFPRRISKKLESRLMLPAFNRKLINAIRPGDVVWVYTDGSLINPLSDARLETEIKRRGAKYVFQLPDAWVLSFKCMRDACERRVVLADLTVTVTPQLTRLMRTTFPGILCETCEEPIDTDMVSPHKSAIKANNDVKTILWCGPPYKSDLANLSPILEAIQSKVSFVLRVVSGDTKPAFSLPFDWEWVPFEKESQNEAFSGADLAIAYYDDNDYSRCKGNFKIKTYMAAGLPIVTSNVGYNRILIQNGVNGILVNNTQQDWEDALVKVLSDSEVAERMGVEAKKSVDERYSYTAIARTYLGVLEKHFPDNISKSCIPS